MSQLFGAVAQNGYVVKDIKKAMDYWINVLGVGPWFYVENVEMDYFRYRGENSDLKMSVALANCGDLQIELVQQLNDAPSMYKDFLDAGREGLQHIAFWYRKPGEYQAILDKCEAQGFNVIHEGCIGGEHGRFAYFDAESHPGSVIEISDMSGVKGQFFDYVRDMSRTWDGKNPIRKMS